MDRKRFAVLATFALFLGSGCAALVYEVVWFHMLSLVIGASGVSLAILLASFMGGMCLGSVAYPRLVPPSRHPLRVYAVLEFTIAAFGMIILWVLPALGKMYCAYAGLGYGGMTFRGLVAGAVLLPPTILMGATLPAVARGVQATREGLSRLGFAYGANTFGAVFGSLLAGFFLLRVYDVNVATCVAALLNLAVGVLALLLAEQTPYSADAGVEVESEMPVTSSGALCSSPVVCFVIGLSGLTALAAEVVWTRLLALLYGPTTYTFSIILAVFLTGIGIGSACGATLARKLRSPGLALAVCQLLQVAAIPLCGYMIVAVVPHWFVNRDSITSIETQMTIDLWRTVCALLPATLVWGASFPLAVAAAARRQADTGRLVGQIYASNTLGAIAGSALGCFVGIPMMGSQNAQQALTFLSAVGGLVMLGSMFLRSRAELGVGQSMLRGQTWRWAGATLFTVIGVSTIMIWFIPAVPPGLLAYGRRVEMWDFSPSYPYVGEGIDADVVVSETPKHEHYFHVSGKCVASNNKIDMRTQRMLGHIPTLLHAEPKSVLVIGCGAGVTAGSIPLHPTVERIVICDIEACVPQAAARCFGRENHYVMEDPRTQVIIDDARHFLASTSEKFDVITSDPIHPWVRGAASLYTIEFFEMCKEHLNPGGVVCQWVPLYESNEEAVRCELGTFFRSFPEGTIWSSDSTGYDLTVVGAADRQLINITALEEQYENNPAFRESMAEVRLGSAAELLGTFVAYGPDLAEWLKGAEMNLDRNLRLQFLAGLSLDIRAERQIFRNMVSGRPRITPLAN